MKLRKLIAALLAGALLASVTGTAMAAGGCEETVGGTVYGLKRAFDCAAEQAKDEIQKNIDKQGLSEAEVKQKVEEQVREKLAPVVKQKLEKSGVKDVPANHWAASSTALLVESGLLKPDASGQMNLGANASVKDSVAIFAKVLGIANSTDTAEQAAKKAEKAGLIQNNTVIDRDMSRVEVARLIAVVLKKSIKGVDVAEYPFNDGQGLSDTEKKMLIVMYKAGIFKGYPDGTFKPENILTKAEIAVLVDRILGAVGQ